jgi:hypothetical protein
MTPQDIPNLSTYQPDNWKRIFRKYWVARNNDGYWAMVAFEAINGKSYQAGLKGSPYKTLRGAINRVKRDFKEWY